MIVGTSFLDMAKSTCDKREKIDKSKFIEVKNICASKDTVKKVKKTILRIGEKYSEILHDSKFVYRTCEKLS